MDKGIVLKSASFEPGGDAQRDLNTERAIEKAGYEIPEKPLPEREDDQSLTPEQRRERNLKDYGRQVDHARKQHDDWHTAVNQPIVIGVPAQEAILELSNGAEVAYYLGRNPDIARKLGKMAPGSARAEVRKLSEMVAAPERVSSRPVRPSEKALVDMTFAEVAALPSYPGKGRDLRRCRGR